MIRALITVLMLSALPSSAAAQSPASLDLFGGYAFIRDPRSDANLPKGWVAGGAASITEWLALTAEAGGNMKTVAAFGSEIRLGVFSVMAGPRASARIGRLTEFAQVLVGAVHASGSAFGITTTSTEVGVQPGVGADYPLTRRLAGRVQIDARFTRGKPDETTPGYQFRAVTGLVYRFDR